RDIDVALAARLAGVPLDEFRMLNPQFNQPVILAAGTPQVLLPYDNADDFVLQLDAHRGPLATWTAWVATKTLRPADAAKIVGMSEAELRDVNHIPPRMLVKAGSTLLVPRSEQHASDVSVQVADSASMMLAPDLPPTRRLSVHVARGGETVASVARRWHVAPTQVASWNHLEASGRFHAGATAVLFIPRAAVTELARATTPAARVAKAPARSQVAHAPARPATGHGRAVARAHAPAVHTAHTPVGTPKTAQAPHVAPRTAAHSGARSTPGAKGTNANNVARAGAVASSPPNKPGAKVAER
ncbi:MAG TPA: LysM peptidoglycan-binding domain-containing protein, partial [Burkholderiaceae bacterium]|nr:LysM peptidoglycan-binding domain-containing protein [Burkholderiaceae bacterium]